MEFGIELCFICMQIPLHDAPITYHAHHDILYMSNVIKDCINKNISNLIKRNKTELINLRLQKYENIGH